MTSLTSRPVERVVIATRRSRLALWQAEHVKQRLQALYPRLSVELLPMSTRGDELLEVRLDKAGGKGLFVKELETALEDGRADLAVHSMKDVPVEMPPGFMLAAITAREDPRDALVSSRYAAIAELPAGAIVGTSSLRRQAQIAERYPALRIHTLRGNLDTRLAKLDRGEYDAVVLAAAGSSGWAWARASGRYSRLRTACPRPGRARSASSAARTGPRSRSCSSRWSIPRAARACAPNARSTARWAATARCRWAPTPSSTARAFVCARWSPRRTGAASRAPNAKATRQIPSG